MTDVERTLGAHEARLTRLELDHLDLRKTIADFRAEVRADNAVLVDKLGKVHDVITSTRGGWQALAWVGGISGSIAAAFLWIYHSMVR